MDFGIAGYVSHDVNRKNLSNLHHFVDEITLFLEKRDYGKDIKEYVIGLICRSPHFDKGRDDMTSKYTKSKKLLEYHIKLDFHKFAVATEKEVEAMFASELLKSLNIVEKMNIKDFDIERFRQDLMEFFASNNIKIENITELDSIPVFLGEEDDQSPGIDFLELENEELDKQGRINLLRDLVDKNKFGKKEWEERGLNPSDPKTSQYMEEAVNKLIKKMIPAIDEDLPAEELKKVIADHLMDIETMELDTEEMEFLCDWFQTLARLAGVDISKELNKLLYGDLADLF